jgi:hypothetical protein
MIGKALKLPAWVDNDANAIAVGEKFFGRARDYLNFTSIVLGRTIGPPTTCMACSIVGTMAARAKSATLRSIQMEHYAAADEMAASRPLLAGPRYVPQPKHAATP